MALGKKRGRPARRAPRPTVGQAEPPDDATGRSLDWKQDLPALRGRPPDVAAWLARELRDQERRYRKIVKEMEALEGRRRRWILEFYKRIQDTGYYVHADIKRRIKPEAIPTLPKKVRVVF